MTQSVFQNNFSPYSPLCSYFIEINGGKEEERENMKKKKKNESMGVRKSQKEREKETVGCLCMTLFHMELMVV